MCTVGVPQGAGLGNTGVEESRPQPNTFLLLSSTNMWSCFIIPVYIFSLFNVTNS